jgi:hypothetical protein
VSSEGLARGAGELSCADSILPSLRPLKLRLLHLRSGWRRRCPLFSVWPAHYGFEWLATRPITEPSRIVLGRKDRWHSIMDLGHQIVPVGGDNRECPDPLTGCRVLPVFP